MTYPVPATPQRKPSKLLMVSWVLLIVAIAVGLYANSIGSPYRGSLGKPPGCLIDQKCTSADIDAAMASENRWLFMAFVCFLLAVILHLVATPGRVVPRTPLTSPWLRSFLASVIAAALVVALVVPFLALAFTGQTGALVLLVLISAFIMVAVPSLTHSNTWARPRLAKVVVILATLAAPAAAMLIAMVPVPSTESMQTVMGAVAVVATIAAHTAGHRLAISASGATAAGSHLQHQQA